LGYFGLDVIEAAKFLLTWGCFRSVHWLPAFTVRILSSFFNGGTSPPCHLPCPPRYSTRSQTGAPCMPALPHAAPSLNRPPADGSLVVSRTGNTWRPTAKAKQAAQSHVYRPPPTPHHASLNNN
jgi:hypothetical protein